MNILEIMNCANFLAGHNPPIQRKTVELSHNFLFEFLELSFLIYEVCRPLDKKEAATVAVSNVVQEEIVCLENIVGVQKNVHLRWKERKSEGCFEEGRANEEPKDKIELTFWLHKVLPFELGQLVAIVRLLSNLVHLNP
jgi:hypothetical protein